MDPVRMTLTSMAVAALLGGILVGGIGIAAWIDYEPAEHPVVQTSQVNLPAAQETLHRAFQGDDPAYMKEGMRMKMRMYGPEDIEIATAEARHDPQTGDHSIHMRLDLEEIATAYGVDMENSDPEDDPFGFADQDTFEMFMAKKGIIHVVDILGMSYTWRDHAPAEDTFDLFGADDDGNEMGMPATIGELEMFLSEDEDVLDYDIEPSSYDGTPTWYVTVTHRNETTTGTANFHFRQSDGAPLFIEADFEGLLDSDTLGTIRENDPDFPLDDITMRMVITFEYGPVEIELPDGATRVGVNVESQHVTTATQHTVTITPEQQQRVPLHELSVHVVIAEPAFFGPPEIHEVLATFDLSAGLQGTANGYQMTFHDHDGDSFLSAGDEVIITNEDGFWSNDTHSAQILFYDRWAGQYEGAPGAPMLWIIGTIAVIAGLARRRHESGRGNGD